MSTFDLTGQQIRNTYTRVLQIDSSSVDFYKPIYDGIGNPIYYAAIKVESCSYADTAASMGGVTNIPGSSSWASQSISSSYAVTASYALNGGGGSSENIPGSSSWASYSAQSGIATTSLTASYINQTPITQLITSSYADYATTAGSVAGYTNLTEHNNGNVSDTAEIDFDKSAYHKIALHTAVFTMSFSHTKNYCRNFIIKCINTQENTDICFAVAGTISSLYWIEGVTPKPSPSASSTDIYSFYFDGSSLYGQIGKNFL